MKPVLQPPAILLAAISLVSFGALLLGVVPLMAGIAVGLAIAALALPPRPRRFLLKRSWQTAVTVFIAMAIVFFFVHNLPDMSRSDDTGVVPAMQKYVEWIGALVGGDLGQSQYSETVGEGVSRTIPVSFQLLLYSQVLALIVAVPCAMMASRWRGRAPDVAIRTGAFFGLSMPIVVVGPVLVAWLAVGAFEVFGQPIGGRWLPAGRPSSIGDGLRDHMTSMLLPTVTLAFGSIASMLAVFRTSMIAQLQLEHAQLALSKGLPPWRIVGSHAARPAAPTLVSLVATQAALVVGNLIIIERLFLLPGFGDYVIVAIGRRDVPAITGGLFVMAGILAVINLIADAIILALDPRIDLESEQMRGR
ncbi:MAG: peptide/nickel transport system permease protein [Candidatus Poriferisodalaceae bacterium]|jgi:peptide/nickel transport system permease protein